jgi:hypothetical protein
MLRIGKRVFRFAVSKEINVNNIFSGQPIAHYYSFDDARIGQLLE